MNAPPTSLLLGQLPQTDPNDSESVHPNFPPTSSTDLIIRSSDNVLFHLHKMNLQAYTGAFPGRDLPVPVSQGESEDVTCLTESGNVLAIVFGFVYPRKQPNLREMDFSTVIAVAEAVEKYEVFSAMTVCEYRLNDFVKTHPQQILIHAVKHDYPSLLDATVPYIARKQVNEVDEILPDNLFRAWCRYREKWEYVFRNAMEQIHIRDMSLSEVAEVLAWQAYPDLIQLQDALEPDLHPGVSPECQTCSYEQPYCQRCDGYRTFYRSKFRDKEDLRDLAELCRAEIAAIPHFTSFLK